MEQEDEVVKEWLGGVETKVTGKPYAALPLSGNLSLDWKFQNLVEKI